MIAPEDDIDFNKKSVVYENKTYKQFEKILQLYKYWEVTEFVLLFILLLATNALIPYLVDLFMFFESDYEGFFIAANFIESHGYVLFILLLLISSYQVYKSITKTKENQKLGLRFYIFQIAKISIYILTKFNLLLVFAFVGIARILLIIFYSKTKSFK